MYLKVLDMYFPDFAKFTRGSEGMSRFGNMLSSMLSHDDEVRVPSSNSHQLINSESISKRLSSHGCSSLLESSRKNLIRVDLLRDWNPICVCSHKTDAHCEHSLDSSNDEVRAPQIDAFHPAHAEQTVRLSIATLLNRAGYSVEAYIILKAHSFLFSVTQCVFPATDDYSLVALLPWNDACVYRWLVSSDRSGSSERPRTREADDPSEVDTEGTERHIQQDIRELRNGSSLLQGPTWLFLCFIFNFRKQNENRTNRMERFSISSSIWENRKLMFSRVTCVCMKLLRSKRTTWKSW